MKKYDIVIVGAGVIGMGIAFELKTREPLAKIVLIDKGEAGREASWAAAGMLEPQLFLKGINFHDASDLQKKFFELCAESQNIFLNFIRRVESISGINCQYRSEGILKLIPSDQSPNQYLEWLESFLIRYHFWDEKELHSREPHVSRGFTAVHLPDNHQVENRKLTESLKTACINLGIEILENNLVVDFEIQNDRIMSIRTASGAIAADKFVLSAGAWSSEFDSLKKAVPRVRPMRGQIVCLQMPSNDFIHHTGYLNDFYYVPRNDGRLLAGSTIEDTGFDKTVVADTIDGFMKKIDKIIPDSGQFVKLDAWAGLRPATNDGFPYFGPTAIKNLAIAAGHFRNGLLLTPITARLMTDFLLHEKIHSLIKLFGVNRG